MTDVIRPETAAKSAVSFHKNSARGTKRDPNAPFEYPKLELPHGHQKLLLHSCCAPCSGEIMEAIRASGIEFAIYFYNPNIHPQKEYLIRKEEHKKYAGQFNIPFFDGDYDRAQWFERTKGLEDEPERGERCTVCFDMRLVQTAKFAHENGYPVFTTSLGISRWKDMNQVNGAAKRAAALFDGVEFWDHNWRKGGGSQRGVEISKREHFYKQEYCGCVYSLRDMNKWREEQGREKIEIGVQYYNNAG